MYGGQFKLSSNDISTHMYNCDTYEITHDTTYTHNIHTYNSWHIYF